MKIKLCALIFILCGLNIFAQNFDWARHDSLVKAGLNHLYNINLLQAEKTFSAVEKEYVSHPSGKFFKALITWWTILLDSENTIWDEILIQKLSEVNVLCNKILEKNQRNYDALLFKAVSYGLKAELQAIRKNWLPAMYNGKNALELSVKCYEIRPGNIDLQFIFGLYHYFADYIFENYTSLKPLQYLLPSGNRNRGLKELENAAWNGRYARIEARFILQYIYYNIEKDYGKSLKWGKYLSSSYPHNPFFTKYYMKALAARGK